MSILEIVILGYVVNMLMFVLFMFMTLVETISKMLFADRVEMAKEVLALEKARGNWISAKEICKTKGILSFDPRNLHMLFPFASVIYVAPFIPYFFRLNLIGAITDDMIRSTNRLDNMIKEHRERKDKNEKL